jgi:hypothetical protein
MSRIRIKRVPIKVRLCKQVQREHKDSCRQFAHTFHLKNTICVCPEFYVLPSTFQVGILLHELGHQALGEAELAHTEEDADRTAFYISGIHIQRRSYHEARNLEAVRQADVGEGKRFLRKYLALPGNRTYPL